MNEEQRKEIRVLREAVNMSPSELEEWLETDESKSVGVPEDGESVGHGPRRILDTKSKTVELTDGDREHMREVVGDVHRHLAQRPDGDVTETNWRYSLMN